MRQLSKDPVFGPMMRQLLSGARLRPDWQRQVRREWRTQQWAQVARDRPHFAGVERGVDRAATLALFNEWTEQADGHQWLLDHEASGP
eukprot:7260671-Alexandrium_andersonii.AAC.1